MHTRALIKTLPRLLRNAIYYLGKVTVSSGSSCLLEKSKFHAGCERTRIIRLWWVTCWSALPLALARLWSKSTWKAFPDTWRMRRWMETASAEISREYHIWLKCGKPSHVIGADRTITAVLVGYGLYKSLEQWIKFGSIIRLEWWWSVTWSGNFAGYERSPQIIKTDANTVNLSINKQDDEVEYTQEIDLQS